jgi:hypothetical protein
MQQCRGNPDVPGNIGVEQERQILGTEKRDFAGKERGYQRAELRSTAADNI